MSNQEQVELLLRGRDVWNEWKRQHPEANIDLSEDTFSFAAFNGANLSGAVRLLTAESVTHKESCLNSDMRIERPASRSGTSWGGKPADKDSDLRARMRKGSESCAPC